MVQFEYILKDPMGLHARPVGQLIKETKSFESKISLVFKDQETELSRMMAVMRLGAKGGDKILVKINGKDETEILEEVKNIFEKIV